MDDLEDFMGWFIGNDMDDLEDFMGWFIGNDGMI